jgi:hypothetical protein
MPLDTINQSYAARANTEYQTDIDKYVSIPERLDELYSRAPHYKDAYIAYAKQFVANWPEFPTYTELCEAMVGMGVESYMRAMLMDINHTMQRKYDAEWGTKILTTFDPILVNRIRTYQDPCRTDGGEERFNAWDGQHTALVLYIIAVYGYGMDPADVMVPIDVYPGHDRAKIRHQFVYYNSGKGTQQLESIDLFKQHVYGYTNDGSRTKMNERCYQIQQIAEKYDMFLTAEKFGDHTYPGAVSRLTEIMKKNIPIECIDSAFFYHSISSPNQQVYSLEFDNMIEFFHKAIKQGAVIDDDYVRELVNVMDVVTGNTWKTKSRKSNKVKAAYKNWYATARKAGLIISAKPPRCNQSNVGPTWITQMLAANGFTKQLPKFDEPWVFATADLK